MRWVHVALVALLGSSMAIAQEDLKTFELPFHKASVGKVPNGWKATQTGKGEGSEWKVIAEKLSPTKTVYYLAQTGESPGPVINLCVSGDSNILNGEVSVVLKAVKGNADQGGGVMWRYKDADNYYMCGLNTQEKTFNIYKVVAGRRTLLATEKDKVKVAADEWHTIKVVVKDDHIDGFLDGKKLLDLTDKTFPKSGKAGLWTRGDAQTHFDKFAVGVLLYTDADSRTDFSNFPSVGN